MRILDNQIELSATDLSNHIACKHLTNLNLAQAEGSLNPPNYYDLLAELLKERGLEFERNYLNSLMEKGFTVCVLSTDDPEFGIEKTIEAIKKGYDVIYQAQLTWKNYYGIADFLIRIDKVSKLGSWSYEVLDSKLAKETRAGTIFQQSIKVHI